MLVVKMILKLIFCLIKFKMEKILWRNYFLRNFYILYVKFEVYKYMISFIDVGELKEC